MGGGAEVGGEGAGTRREYGTAKDGFHEAEHHNMVSPEYLLINTVEKYFTVEETITRVITYL